MTSPLLGSSATIAPIFPCHRLFRRLLHIEVERQHDALARMVGNFLQHAQPPPDRVDFDLLAAGLAAQERFPSALEAELPDLIAHLVAGLHEIVAIDLADIAEQMSRERCRIDNDAPA